MSEHAGLELQGAVTARLKAHARLVALIDDRVYDRVPRDSAGQVAVAKFPYVSFGPEQEIPDDADCISGSEFVFQLDAWSRKVGFPEVKRIAGAIEDALAGDMIELNDNALVFLVYDGCRIIRDSDGLTSHAALTFRAMIEKT